MENEELYLAQVEISEAINKLIINFKKDGPERKTLDYFKRRLETLEAYWTEYEHNHDRFCTEASRSHTYFTNTEYEQTFGKYNSAKALFNQQYQELIITKIPAAGVSSKAEQVQQSGKAKEVVELEPSGQLAGQQQLAGPSGQTAKQQQSADLPGHSAEKQIQFKNQGSSSKLDEMLKKQTANFKAFIRTVASIDVDILTDKWEFEDALKSLQSRWVAIDCLHWEIDSEQNGQDESYERIYTKYEKKYTELKKAINTKLWSVSHRDKSTPLLDIPIFYGYYNQWVSFKDLFQEAIHNNPSLSNAQKMQFLKSKVKGEAERLIQHLQISSENYAISWDILNHRYNNKKLLFTSYINILLGLPNIQQQAFISIKKMHDVTLECLHSIKNLGIDVSTWDPILVHILSQKLDSESYNDYVEFIKNPRDLPNLQEFLNYLETKFTSLETARRKQEPKTSSSPQYRQQHQQSSNIKKPYYTLNNSFNKVTKPQQYATHTCPLCKNNHGLYNCNKFLEMSNETKLKTIRNLHVCVNCLFDHNGNKCKSIKRCRLCGSDHNSILHDACTKVKPTTSGGNSTNAKSTPGQFQHNLNSAAHVSQENTFETLLATAKINVLSADGSYQTMRALIDQGSQISLITEHAAQKIGLKRQKCSGVIFGVGQTENNCKGMLDITCSSLVSDYSFNVEVLIMNNLVKHLPSKSFIKPSWQHIENITLADPEFNISRPVDLLLGAEVYSRIMIGGIIKGDHITQPIAQQTHLGWLLCGSIKTYQCNVVLNNLEDIKSFWEVEDITTASNLSNEEQNCISYYKDTTKRLPNGRYEVMLPLKDKINENLGSSKQIAMAQFFNLERKFRREPVLAMEYKLFFNEYEQLQHMERASSTSNLECYLPHHCVQRESSTTTRYRAVFNASSKTSSGYSLNDLMFTGPNLQQDLQMLILKFRQYPYGFTADIEKMYRQIKIAEEHRKYQKVLWRENEDQPIQIYQLNTVTYGTKAAPYLAMMTLQQLASDERDSFPEAAQVVEHSFYMDDLVHGAYSLNEGKQLIEKLHLLLQKGGFNLRKWSSNNRNLLDNIESKSDEQEIFNFKSQNKSKILGLFWDATEDKFMFEININQALSSPTKRQLLSEISKIFDPLGWLAPVTTKLKLMFQKVYVLGLQWDDVIPNDIASEWDRLRLDIKNINDYKVPRWIGCNKDDVIQLHGFCDASSQAYACVIYARIEKLQQVIIVAAKSKLVPPTKGLTIPQLELCAADLLAKLMTKVLESLNQHNIVIFGWSDSKVVLAWLQNSGNKWKQFVVNRVKNVVKVMPADCWRYVKSAENPADSASRGQLPSQLKENTLWLSGPTWLSTYQKEKKSSTEIYTTNEEAKKSQQSNVITQSVTDDSIIKQLLVKHSSLSRVIRIVAWIKRFINKEKARQAYLSLNELRQSQLLIVKHIQSEAFKEEISNLQAKKSVSTKSTISKLKPYLDEAGILRVGGRLENAHINIEMKHPIIIPSESRLSELIIDHAHKLTFHGGARLTNAFIRQKYWIVGGNRLTKKQIRLCVTCRRNDPSKHHQIMGDLPTARSNPSRPFYHTGVDYTGHVFIKTNKGRGTKTTKGYIAVFICMATKAVHLELVSDLTSSAFLAALKRMAARKGTPGHLYSDQGTNFIKANRVLQEEFVELSKTNQDFIKELTEIGINWHFNVPSWPSAGGVWESAVKSLKYHLKRVVGDQKLTYEEYSTILAQLEACLNSRPLCPLSEDPDDLNFITPSHFLTHGPTLSLYDTEHDLRTRWHLAQKIFEDIWKRWRSEYLTQLNIRSKWTRPQRNIQINDVVIIHDANLPAGNWALGRVVELHTGADGFVRVVTLKTKNGLLKRPIVKLSVLPTKPVNSNNDEHIENQDTAIDENTSSNKQKRKYKQSKKGFSLATMIMSLLLLFITNFSPTEGKYNITSLQSNKSLYFDKITNMYLIRDDWKLIVYYDMEPYSEGNRAFSKHLNYLENICTKIRTESHCEAIMLQLRHGDAELEYYNRMLLSQHFGVHSRRRRGLINALGNVANSLFGVLDDRFAEQYEKDIGLIRKNQKHLATLWKKQTSVVEAEFNLLQRTKDIMDKQHKFANQRMLDLENNLNALKTKLQNMSSINDFTLSALITNNMLIHLQSIQDNILDTLTDIYNGKINLHLLTPDQLSNELNIISSKLPSDLSLPVYTADLTTIYKLLKVKTKITKNYVLFEIKIPLISRDLYDILRIIPIPKQLNDTMTFLKPVTEYAAVNLQRDALLSLSENDLNSCLHLDTETSLCYLKRPIYHIKDDESLCETHKDSRTCQATTTFCSNKWEELNKINTYFYFCCGDCTLQLMCEDQITTLQLKLAGLLIVSHGCIIKSKDFIIYPHRQDASSMNIKANIESIDIAPINHLFNLQISNLSSSNMSDHDANDQKTQMAEIRKQIDTMKQTIPLSDEISNHDIHHYAAIYIVIIIIVVGGTVLVWKRYRKHRGQRAQRQQQQQSSGQCCVSESVSYSKNGQSSGKAKCSEVKDKPINSHKIRRDHSTSPVLRSVLTISDDSA